LQILIKVLLRKRRQGETCEKHTHTQILKLWRLLNIKIFVPNILSPNIHSHQAMHLEQSGLLLRTWGICCEHEKNQHRSPPSSKGKKLGPLNACSSHWPPKNFHDYLCPLTLLGLANGTCINMGA